MSSFSPEFDPLAWGYFCAGAGYPTRMRNPKQ